MQKELMRSVSLELSFPIGVDLLSQLDIIICEFPYLPLTEMSSSATTTNSTLEKSIKLS